MRGRKINELPVNRGTQLLAEAERRGTEVCPASCFGANAIPIILIGLADIISELEVKVDILYNLQKPAHFRDPQWSKNHEP